MSTAGYDPYASVSGATGLPEMQRYVPPPQGTMMTTSPTPAGDIIAAPIKPGFKTTEFWLTVLTNITSLITMFSGLLPARYALMVMAVYNGAYATLRTLQKAPDITTLVEIKK